jgi:arylsulfatase
MRFTLMSVIRRCRSEIVLSAALLTIGVVARAAQQPNCPPGSACATTSIDGKQLPPPPFKFEGKIEKNAPQSKPYWPPRIRQRARPTCYSL